MKHFLIYTNQYKDSELKTTNRIKQYLEEKEQTVSVRIITQDWKATNWMDVKNDPILSQVDCMLVLGGDGTVLQAVRETKDLDVPLIGVNLGNLGFMTQIELSNLEESLDRLIAGDYDQEERMMLNGKITFEDGTTRENWALNDVVVARCGSLQMIQLQVFVNGHFLNDYSGDGIIVTTPTGSTGYNLSAGGPIVEPKAKLILLTPICPHSLGQRSIVLSAEDEIEICVAPGRDGKTQKVEVSFDGTHGVELCTGDKLRIAKSKEKADFIELNKISFVKVLHQKMKESM